MKVRILTQESYYNWPENQSGSSRIRGRWLAKYWEEAELYKVGEQCDVMIFQKVYWRDMMRDFPGIKILDICDPDFFSTDYMGIVEMMGYCHACVASTEALAEEVRKYTDKPVICIPDRFDLEYFQTPKNDHTTNLAISVDGKEYKTRDLKVVWYGYAHNAEVLDIVYTPLKKLGIKLMAISDKCIIEADEWVQYNWTTIHAYMKSCDFAIMPEHKSRKYKSNNKTVESWLCGLPVAHNYEELQKFMDVEARKIESKEKYKYAVENYDIKLSVDEYKKLIKELDGKR